MSYYHYGARIYDPLSGRFVSTDPIADEFAFVTPYNYAENEPIANVDLHGLQSYHNAALQEVDKLKQRFRNVFSSVFGVSVSSSSTPSKSPTFVKVEGEVSGKVVVGVGAGIKGNVMGAKVEAEADIGSVKIVEASTSDGVHLVNKDGEVRTERGGALMVGLMDQVNVGVEAERESAVQNGKTISDAQTLKAGVQIGGKVYGVESSKDLVTDNNGKIKSTDPSSKQTTLSVGLGAQFILGGEGKFKINITTSKTKPKSEKDEG